MSIVCRLGKTAEQATKPVAKVAFVLPVISSSRRRSSSRSRSRSRSRRRSRSRSRRHRRRRRSSSSSSSSSGSGNTLSGEGAHRHGNSRLRNPVQQIAAKLAKPFCKIFIDNNQKHMTCQRLVVSCENSLDHPYTPCRYLGGPRPTRNKQRPWNRTPNPGELILSAVNAPS